VTDLTSHELAERIIRSLKENSADFERQRRAHRLASVRRILVITIIFAVGLAAGVLLKAVL
jgi:hypothetical protein